MKKIEESDWTKFSSKLDNKGNPKGENFFSPSEDYVREFAGKEPNEYKHLLEIEVAPGTTEFLANLKAGRSEGNIVAQRYPNMAMIEEGMAVQFKEERGIINIGLRPPGLQEFNNRIITIRRKSW